MEEISISAILGTVSSFFDSLFTSSVKKKEADVYQTSYGRSLVADQSKTGMYVFGAIILKIVIAIIVLIVAARKK